MKMMRHKRTGRLVVYDASLLEMGTYEVVENLPQQSPPPQKKRPTDDQVAMNDEIQIRLFKQTEATHEGQ